MSVWRAVPVIALLFWGVTGVGCGVEGGDDVAGSEALPEAALEADVTGFGGVNGPQPCGQSPRLVGDIRPGLEGSSPEALVVVNSRVFFSADDGVNGRELWVMDGDVKARLVKDVRPGPYGSTPRFLTRMGGRLFFVADDGMQGPELWVSDGTAKGTMLVADIRPGTQGSAPDMLTVVGSRLYFTADDGARGRELWSSDGTAKGTQLAQEFVPGPGSVLLDDLTAWDGKLALVAYGDAVVTLWVLDAKTGTSRAWFQAPAQTAVFSLTPANDRLFFLVDVGLGEADLWVTRGALLSTLPLKHFSGDYPVELTALGSAVYFMAGADGFFGEPGDLLHGGELWKSDGTLLGTRLVKDIWPGPRSSLPSGLTALDGRLYFAADDGARGRELWSSDGTASGTVLMKDLEPGPVGSSPTLLSAPDGWLYFSATTTGRGREGWFTNGQPDRVTPMRDIAPGAQDANPRNFVRAGGYVFFLATSPTQGEEPWALPFLPAARCAKL
jgi:ELWxxDGT repeat protein